MAAATAAGGAPPPGEDPPPDGAPAGVADAEEPSAKGSASVPLRARPPASAEPSAAPVFGVPGFGSRGEASPETAENAVAAPMEADGEARLGEEPGSVAVFEPPAEEILAERIGAPGNDSPVVLFDHGLEAVEEDPEPPVALAPSTPAGARPRFPPAPGGSAPATPVGVPLRSSGGRDEGARGEATATTRRRGRDDQPPEALDDEPRTGGSVLRLLAAAIVIVAVLVFIATRLFGGTSTPASNTSTTTGSQSSSLTAPSPGSITVAVLNGTRTAGLAARVSSTLAGAGFKPGAVANALSRGHHVTLVGYAPGDRAAAEVVAKQLQGRLRIGPADPRTLTAAQGQSTLTPSVVITLGSDYQPQ
jgi:hypothetical protein